MPTEGQHRAGIEHHVGVGARLALRVHAPAFGNGLAGPSMQLDIAPGNRTGSEVEHKGVLARPRPAEGNGVGAKHRLIPTRRRDPGMAGITGERHEAGGGQLFDLDPQCREMHTAIDRQRGNAIGPGLLHQQWQTGLKRQLRKTTGGIDPHNRRRLIDHLRLGIGRNLAGPERIHTTQHPVQAMGSAAIALPGNHRGRHRLGVGQVKTVVQQDRFGQLTSLGQGQSDHNPLLEQTDQPGADGRPRLDRFSQGR
ncbi:hypothetical protein D3C73_676660 [compost metagenome]